MILDAYEKEFKHRLRQRKICPELKNYEQRTELICKLYLSQSKKILEPDYSMEELYKVRCKLKRGKQFGIFS